MKEKMAAALVEQIPDADVRVDSEVRLTCPSGVLGDVVLREDAVGVIVEIEGSTHGHFDHFPDERENIDAAVSFVSDLVDGRVVVWSVAGGRMGGWFYVEHGPPEFELPPDTRFATWTRELERAEL